MALAFVLFVMWMVFFPTFADCYRFMPTADAKVRSKSIAEGLDLYAADFDTRLPHVTSMPSFRALTNIYVKGWFMTSTPNAESFSFNVAGVSTSQIDQPHFALYWISFDQRLNRKQAPFPDTYEHRIAAAMPDGESGFISSKQLLDTQSLQFDRTGATLAPAEYLADQDPLR